MVGGMFMQRSRMHEHAADQLEAATQPTAADMLVAEHDAMLLSSGRRSTGIEYRQVYGTVVPLPGDGAATAVVRERKTYSVVMDQMHECSDVLVHSSRESRPFALETSHGRVAVDPEGCSLQAPTRARYVHDFGEGTPRPTGVTHAIGRALSSEKEVGVLETECAVPVGSTAYVTGAVRTEVDSSGAPVLLVSGCANPRLPFVVSDRPASNLLGDARDKAVARRYVGLCLSIAGIVASMVEQMLPSSFRSYTLAPYTVREIVSEHAGLRVVEFVVSAPMSIVMSLADAMRVLRASGKISRHQMPAEVAEKNNSVSFKFYYAKPTWTFDYCRIIALRACGWAGVAFGALAVMDFLFEGRKRLD